MDIWLQTMDIDDNKSVKEMDKGFECKSDVLEYIDQVSDDLLCPICFNPIWPPKLLICGHVFCESCIKSNIIQNGHNCPVCNQQVRSAYISYHIFSILLCHIMYETIV